MSRVGNRPVPHYVVVAEGAAHAPWLVMVHAAVQDHRMFSAQVPVLGGTHRLLLIDLPGHGGSRAYPGPFGFEEHADAVSVALEHAGVARADYLGTHTGAVAGLILAARDATRFRSLVLEGPVIPGTDMPTVAGAVERVKAVARSRGVEAARDHWYRHEPWYDVVRTDPVAFRADEHLAMLADFEGRPWLDETPSRALLPVADRLAALDLPVLIVNGEHDVPDFLEAAEALQRLMPEVECVRIPRAGAFPLWEFPDRFNQAVVRFLARHRSLD